MMIVIADDFTGSAELAGISWQYGFDTAVRTNVDLRQSCDVLILDSDIRSRRLQEIEKILPQLTVKLAKFDFDTLYIKIDSVLRGHILRELEILMEELGYSGALMVPANPSVNRIIKNGHYFIDGIPLNETDFAYDPEYPRLHSDIPSLLGATVSHHLNVLKADQKLSEQGIQIGDCHSVSDLEHWAAQLTPGLLPVGASDFFEQIIKMKPSIGRQNLSQKEFQHQFPLLGLVGSISGQSAENLKIFTHMGIPVCYPPSHKDKIRSSEPVFLENWVDQIVKTLENNQIAIVATNNLVTTRYRDQPRSIIMMLSNLIKRVYRRVYVRELVIEGGATASAVIRKLGWEHLKPRFEFDRGIVALSRADDPDTSLVVKPGSYLWPDAFYDGLVPSSPN